MIDRAAGCCDADLLFSLWGKWTLMSGCETEEVRKALVLYKNNFRARVWASEDWGICFGSMVPGMRAFLAGGQGLELPVLPGNPAPQARKQPYYHFCRAASLLTSSLPLVLSFSESTLRKDWKGSRKKSTRVFTALVGMWFYPSDSTKHSVSIFLELGCVIFHSSFYFLWMKPIVHQLFVIAFLTRGLKLLYSTLSLNLGIFFTQCYYIYGIIKIKTQACILSFPNIFFSMERGI